MKLYDFGATLVIAFVVICLGSALISSKVTKTEDGPIEEFFEDLAYSASGIDIDVTPNSPEDEKEARLVGYKRSDFEWKNGLYTARNN